MNAETPICECPTDDYCPKCHPRWHAKWRAEQDCAAWVARIEALADESVYADFTMHPSYGDDVALAVRATALRALLTSDSTAALDAVKAEAGRAAGERIAAAIEAVLTNDAYTADTLRCAANIARADQIGGAS